MEERTLSATIQVFESLEEFSKKVQKLMQNAIEAREKAYAPYSKFLVGAAVLLENGKIITGSNQENAAYPSGLCAERTAIYYAGAQYPDVNIKSIAVSVKSLKKTIDLPIPPCGACRQAIAEYEFKQKEPISIYFMGEVGNVIKTNSLLDLLPLAFDSSFL